VVNRVLKKEKGRVLMRSLGPLTDEEIAVILSMANELAKKYQPN
jgi:hypothetical protein